jgi:hypothetical protein
LKDCVAGLSFRFWNILEDNGRADTLEDNSAHLGIGSIDEE